MLLINTISIVLYTVFTFVIMCTAIVATKSWKNEIVANKLKELNEEAYELLKVIKEKLELWSYRSEVEEVSHYEINDEATCFFNKLLKEKKLPKLIENLKRTRQNTKILEYFKVVVDQNSNIKWQGGELVENVADDPTGIYPDWPCFWSSYVDKELAISVKIDKHLKAGLKYYDKKITEFYK